MSDAFGEGLPTVRTPTRSQSRSRQRSLTRRPSQGNLAEPQATPRPRPPLPTSSAALSAQTSPHYSTSLRSRHSLYGTEDRVVLDLGSRIWKVGFSGEPNPRECKSVLIMLGVEQGGDSNGATTLWGLEKGEVGEVEWEVREERLKRGLRNVWFNNLMSDPKARKVIVIENALMSTRVKTMIARVLFENLQVPSLNFASSHLLSLLATGTVTGLVIDVGNLETTALSIYSSRPLYPLLLATPTAGRKVTSRLRSLLLRYGKYVPPPPSMTTIPASPTPTKIPPGVLTEELLEEIKTRCCFVGDPIVQPPTSSLDDLFSTQTPPESEPDESEADFAMDLEEGYDEASDLPLLRRMEKRYKDIATAKTISLQIPAMSGPVPTSGVGKGWLLIPGWVRERAAEVLFEEGTEDERSVTEVILEALLRVRSLSFMKFVQATVC
ncbi:actin-related protein 10, partial [Phenoliferia sp. Uapishka_3]